MHASRQGLKEASMQVHMVLRLLLAGHPTQIVCMFYDQKFLLFDQILLSHHYACIHPQNRQKATVCHRASCTSSYCQSLIKAIF